MPRALVYDRTMYILAGMLVVGLISNLLVRPVAAKWFMDPPETDMPRTGPVTVTAASGAGIGTGAGAFSPIAFLAWASVGLPIAWGVWITVSKASALFR